MWLFRLYVLRNNRKYSIFNIQYSIFNIFSWSRYKMVLFNCLNTLTADHTSHVTTRAEAMGGLCPWKWGINPSCKHGWTIDLVLGTAVAWRKVGQLVLEWTTWNRCKLLCKEVLDAFRRVKQRWWVELDALVSAVILNHVLCFRMLGFFVGDNKHQKKHTFQFFFSLHFLEV